PQRKTGIPVRGCVDEVPAIDNHLDYAIDDTKVEEFPADPSPLRDRRPFFAHPEVDRRVRTQTGRRGLTVDGKRQGLPIPGSQDSLLPLASTLALNHPK